MCKSEEELEELDPTSTDIFKHNMLDRYMDRPDATFKGGKYNVLNEICYAEFLAHYEPDSKPREVENDYQPEIVNDEMMEGNEKQYPYPAKIPLMNSKNKLKCRKRRAILRFHVPNRHKDPEKYAHHILFMYYPFRAESDLLHNTFVEKLAQPGVLDIVNENKEKTEPYEEFSRCRI